MLYFKSVAPAKFGGIVDQQLPNLIVTIDGSSMANTKASCNVFYVHNFHKSLPNDAIYPHKTWSSLFQVTAYGLFGVKPLP